MQTDTQETSQEDARFLGYCAGIGDNRAVNPFFVHSPNWFSWRLGFNVGQRARNNTVGNGRAAIAEAR